MRRMKRAGREEWEKRLVRARERGHTIEETCRFYGVSRITVTSWMREISKGTKVSHAVVPRGTPDRAPLPTMVRVERVSVEPVPECELVVRIGDASITVRDAKDLRLLVPLLRAFAASPAS